MGHPIHNESSPSAAGASSNVAGVSPNAAGASAGTENVHASSEKSPHRPAPAQAKVLHQKPRRSRVQICYATSHQMAPLTKYDWHSPPDDALKLGVLANLRSRMCVLRLPPRPEPPPDL
eukprot:5202975-Pleurochrysis_carterae.AAC.2